MERKNKYHVVAGNLKRLEVHVTRILQVLYEWEIHKRKTKLMALNYIMLI